MSAGDVVAFRGVGDKILRHLESNSQIKIVLCDNQLPTDHWPPPDIDDFNTVSESLTLGRMRELVNSPHGSLYPYSPTLTWQSVEGTEKVAIIYHPRTGDVLGGVDLGDSFKCGDDLTITFDSGGIFRIMDQPPEPIYSSSVSSGCYSTSTIPNSSFQNCISAGEHDRRYMGQKPEGLTDKKKLKAECKAQLLIQDIIGLDEWKKYRKTGVIGVYGKRLWLIGDIFQKHDRFNPFVGKPGVVRVDQRFTGRIEGPITGLKVPVTDFCIYAHSREQTPYSDKVISCVVQCAYDEKGFNKTANSMGERLLKKIPEHGAYDIS